MNFRRVLRMLGLVVYALAAAQLLPLVWCISPDDPASARGFAIGAALSAALGLAMRHFGHTEGELYRREGVLAVVGAWGLASLLGAIPYLVTGAIPNVAEALFESTSGFTTTGASILTDIEALSPALLFWRSLTQWLGGIGIVVLFVALLSELGPGTRFLFKLEVPGPKAEILHARVRQTAVALFRIYLGLSVAQVLAMLALGAGFYDALVHTFSTVSTGGFSPYADSVGRFSAALQGVVMVFMLVSGVNFSLYYAFVARRSTQLLRDLELRTYLGLALAVALLVAFDVASENGAPGAGRVVLDAAFQAVSILTTTGFATADFAEWPTLSRVLLVGLMFVGGCAGSTAGGAKVIRVLIGWVAALREVRLTFSPNSVVVVTVGGQPVPEESLRGVVALLLLWGLGWGVGSLLLAVGPVDIVTASTASLATLSNVGPGLAAVGPEGSFHAFAPWQKLAMCGLMLLGRLEFFALLALALPRFWRA